MLIPHFRALRVARDQLYGLQGDVSFIDNALNLAAKLKASTTATENRLSSSTTMDDDQALQANIDTPVESLLARGSAADLETIHEAVPWPELHGSPQTMKMSQRADGPFSKRPQLDNAMGHGRRQRDRSSSPGQRLSSRDAMPPPPKDYRRSRVSGRGDRPIPLRNQDHDRSFEQKLPSSGRIGYNAMVSGNETRASTPRSRSMGRRNDGYNVHLSDSYNNHQSTHQIQQGSDGELDQDFRFSLPQRHTSGISPIRLTLPPSTPSIASLTNQRRRLGISANARTSQRPFPTPNSMSFLPERFGHRPSSDFHRSIPSPHFSKQGFATRDTAQAPDSGHQALPNMDQGLTAGFNRHAFAPAPIDQGMGKLSWLTAPFNHAQYHIPRSSHGQDLLSGSGAYRMPGGPRETVNQTPSTNALSFTNEPQVGEQLLGQTSKATFANHSRRAVRR
ncbi:MAG: hypothetical protein Q9222_000366 [Ikaeria aurantiellina]